MTLGSRIAQYRKNGGMTQESLARKLGVTNQAVSKWESDQSCPDVMLLPEIADVFGITLDALFGREAVSTAEAEPKRELPWPDDGILRIFMFHGHRLAGGGIPGQGQEYRYEADVKGVISGVCFSCGNVAGNVSAAADVTCGSVMGDVLAGGSVACGDVYGGVKAGAELTCGDIYGSVHAGGNVVCADIMGGAGADGSVMIRNGE